MFVWCLHWKGKGVESSGTEVTGECELLCRGKSRTAHGRALEEQSVLVTPEAPLQPAHLCLVKTSSCAKGAYVPSVFHYIFFFQDSISFLLLLG